MAIQVDRTQVLNVLVHDKLTDHLDLNYALHEYIDISHDGPGHFCVFNHAIDELVLLFACLDEFRFPFLPL